MLQLQKSWSLCKECPYPLVKKYTTGEQQQRRDRRRKEKGKALVGESDKGKEIESEESESEDDSTSSSDIEALYCNIFKYQSEDETFGSELEESFETDPEEMTDFCLTENDEVHSHTLSTSDMSLHDNISFSESFRTMMRNFESIT